MLHGTCPRCNLVPIRLIYEILKTIDLSDKLDHTKEARSAEQAIRMATSLAAKEGHCGAIAFSRTGDPALGEFQDAVILKTFGEVDIGLLSV
jgi:hypothetical protein